MIRIYLDANVIIEAFEGASASKAHIWPLLNGMEAGALEGVTSQITLAEVLPKPLALAQTDLVDAYEQLLSPNGSFQIQQLTASIAKRAALIRVERRSIKLPDAIHQASAREARCHAIVTADRRLTTRSGPPVLHPASDLIANIEALVA